jgi:5-methylthioribose kinase
MLKPVFKAAKLCLVFARECKAADVITAAVDVEKPKRGDAEKSLYAVDQVGDGGFNFLFLV